MAGIDDVLERLVTDAAFRRQLSEDPAQALSGYQLDEADLEMLAAHVTEDSGGSGAVEQRTSKSAVAGMLGALIGDEAAPSTGKFDGSYHVTSVHHPVHTPGPGVEALVGLEQDPPSAAADEVPGSALGADTGPAELGAAGPISDAGAPPKDLGAPPPDETPEPDHPLVVGSLWNSEEPAEAKAGGPAGLRSDGELVQDEPPGVGNLTSEQGVEEAKHGDIVIKGKQIDQSDPVLTQAGGDPQPETPGADAGNAPDDDEVASDHRPDAPGGRESRGR